MHTKLASKLASKQDSASEMEGGRLRRRDQLRGIHAHAMGLIAIRYPTGRSACQQFACSLLLRRNDWVLQSQRGVGMPHITAHPNSDRDRQGPARVSPCSCFHMRNETISHQRVLRALTIFAQHKPQNSKESRPRPRSTPQHR